ncbi:amyloid-beta A4 precursor protein-binding family A member 1 isoform X4 [Haemorhous mexicanus]|uniref:amyloid-beta A4 precursor protein-binding family A member 1 isoform X4 n=1 Tax=Haemorhous mexicanus TaxID=30427 RepID=UPI0028BE02CE|nr:amyloid-beta A4 precursor protein-binding family A member 1 isoform X4 [Haemorhous mexicanus]
MNHLVGPPEGEISEEPANGAVSESVEADLERSEVEEEQRYAVRYPRHTNSSRVGLSGQEEEGMLARSASTESGFHNHTDTAEGDVIATEEDSYDVERVQENEDESAYAVQYRPESEEYTENAEAEHGEAIHNRTLPNHLNFHSIEHEEAMNAAYSGYVYTHRLFHRGEDEQYAEAYADYGLQEHVYEEIGDTPDLDVREGIQQYEREREEADNYRKEALGARLHHYDERSDGESDSPEKEAEFAPYPRMDSYEQEEDIDQIVAEVKQSMSSQSLDKAAEDMPESEQSLEHGQALVSGGHESNGQLTSGSRVISGSGEAVQRYSKEKRDAISLAIKDIKEAIEEVKTRTIRSPYTPDEPKEPIWVMRQDISPSRDSDDQRPLDGDSPSPDSSSPRGAESSSRQHHQDVCSTAEASTNKEAPEGESQPMTEVDLFISTQRIKVLNADTQETMMDHPLRTISYIADIGNIVVLMARRRMPRSNSQDNVEASHPSQDGKRQYKMICHVFESEDAQLIAQSIGQAFSVAYQEFLRANGINPEDLSQKEYSDLLNTQDMYNDDLIHFSKSENCKDVYIEKQKGEILGVVIVESGWGSILPTVIIANMMHGGPAEKSGKLNIGDQIMSINGTSLVGLPLSTCQSIIKGLKNQARVKLNIVRCPPVTTVLIRRPDLRYQLGFSVQNGIICSLMRGGIAERGGVRVGHRIIEINGQSVVATPHEKIVHILSNAVGEIHMKTMPAAMYRLLTAQEQPVYI